MDNEYQEILPKVSGYLEKKGRKRMISCYKKYWFVLEGRLLLYYKSKDEYEKAISPCKGFVSLGHTSNVKPGGSNPGVFQIESKTTTITLRAETKEEQHKWMHALMAALNQKNDFKRLNHFRYSTGDLLPPLNNFKSEMYNSTRQNETTCSVDSTMRIVHKLQKLGAKTYGISAKLQKSKSSLHRPISLSDEHIPSHSSKSRCRLQKSESAIVDNEICRKEARLRRASSIGSPDSSLEQIYERIPNSDDSVFIKNDITSIDQEFRSNRTTLLADNGIYWSRCNYQEMRDSNEDCYEAIDFNDNIQPQVPDQTLNKISPSEENIYVDADIKTSTSDNSMDCVIVGSPDQFVSSQECFGDKDKRRFRFNRKSNSLKEKPVGKPKKVKKSESFLHRVWNKKNRTKPKKDVSLSSLNIAKNISIKDFDTMKTPNQLHGVPNCSAEQSNTIQAIESNGETEPTSKKCDEFIKENHVTDWTAKMQEGISDCPSLPPRNTKLSSNVPLKETTKLPTVPPKIKRTAEPVRSIDAILSDLSLQNHDVKNAETDNEEGQFKVKELIKRFSIGKEEGVELRQKQRNWKHKPDASAGDSNDLDKLLEELAKVTTAPIMTPGVTSSLINPEISQKQIQKMVPTRRTSDPDYDIPRPHRSLPNLPKKDDNALEATRFFGPILKPMDYHNESDRRPPTPPADYHSNVLSITPDSLEVENKKIDLSHDELRHTSFHSHEYVHFRKASHHNLHFLVEDHLYADPRLLLTSKSEFSVDSHDTNYQLEGSDCVFVDSLDS